MSDAIVYDESSDVANAAGAVIVKGPDGVDVSMTPRAAVETAARLIDNAAAAEGKRMLAEDLKEREGRA